MSLRITQVLLGLSLLLNAFVLAGFVFHSWFEPPPPRHAGGRWGNPLEALGHDLKLDDAQKKELQPLFDQYTNARRDRFHDIAKVREEMTAELQKPSFDMAKIDSLVDQMMALRVDLQKQNLHTIDQMAQKLKPEQRDELHKILAERYGRPPGWRSQRPPRPSQ
ncbi:MAG: periplasmic heavy metal sensor [Proteobacteria bacterium]|nr:periplasmic heavy metal sensor [Pseudomonadota bacterium]